MENFIYFAGGVIAGWGVAIVASQSTPHLVGFVLIVGALLLIGGFKLSGELWPRRDKWLVEFRHNSLITSPIELQQRIREKDKRLSWTSPEPQSQGDSLRIDFGKYRIIDGIEFYEMNPSNEFPSQWTLLLEDRWHGLAANPISGDGRIIRTFHPTKVHAVEIVIDKPRVRDSGTPYPWRVSIISFRETRLSGKFWRHKI